MSPRFLRALLWGLLVAKLVGGWGVGWDIRWHLAIGRDSFWIAPHVMIYAAVGAGAALALLGLVLAPSAGFRLAWWGMVTTIVAAPIDDLWHRMFGLDVTLWSPPHLLGFAGSQVHTLGCLLIALEAWPARSRARDAALLLGGMQLLGTFQVTADPAIQTAFHRGGVFFFTFAVLGALLFAFTLALTTRLTGWRSAPVVLVLGAVAAQYAMFWVADLGFALTRPVSALQDAIAADPTSPIAIAHEMARRNGTEIPSRSLTLRWLPLIPAALMVWADTARRWRLGAVAFGASFAVVSWVVLSRYPALAHALPGAIDVVLGVVLSAAAALLGGWCALRLGVSFRRREPEVAPGGARVMPAAAQTLS